MPRPKTMYPPGSIKRAAKILGIKPCSIYNFARGLNGKGTVETPFPLQGTEAELKAWYRTFKSKSTWHRAGRKWKQIDRKKFVARRSRKPEELTPIAPRDFDIRWSGNGAALASPGDGMSELESACQILRRHFHVKAHATRDPITKKLISGSLAFTARQ